MVRAVIPRANKESPSRKVSTYDLTEDGHDNLAGYWGGFSGTVNGTVLGFLSPLFNGRDYHGNAVQVTPTPSYIESCGQTRSCRKAMSVKSTGVCQQQQRSFFRLEPLSPRLSSIAISPWP